MELGKNDAWLLFDEMLIKPFTKPKLAAGQKSTRPPIRKQSFCITYSNLTNWREQVILKKIQKKKWKKSEKPGLKREVSETLM